MRPSPRSSLCLGIALLSAGCGLLGRRSRPIQSPEASAAALARMTQHPERPVAAQPILEAMRSQLALYRKLVVLFAQEETLQGPAREAALREGHRLHHDDRAMAFHLDQVLETLTGRPAPERDPVIRALLDYLERDPELLELDKLAFRDSLRILKRGLTADPGAPARELTARITGDLAALDHAEARVEAEYRQVAASPGKPGGPGDRALWNAYVDRLRKLTPAAPAPAAAPALPAGDRELSGRELPDKVLVLTFDDGPHRVYTGEIKTILQKAQVPAVFFEVGRGLGAVDASGAVKLAPLSSLTADLAQSGFVIGNHSYTHAQLSKERGAPLEVEIGETDQLLRAIPGAHSQLFRFPYGARTPLQLQALQGHHLRSVLWNIDSMDWADPVPASVADRVLKEVARERRGIILFHDIHDRAGKVLPALIPTLRAQGYRFAGLSPEGEVVLPPQ